MQPKRNGPQGKKSITDEIDKLRQRREDRKTKEDRKAQIGNPSQDSNKVMDIEYEKMILKKKNEIFQIEPQHVYILIKNSLSILQMKTQRLLYLSVRDHYQKKNSPMEKLTVYPALILE